MDSNEGIINNNGSINATNLAVGKNAKIEVLSGMLDQLISQLHTTPGKIDNKEDTLATITSMKEEIHKEKPDKSTLKELGTTTRKNLEGLTNLTPIIGTIWQHLSTFL